VIPLDTVYVRSVFPLRRFSLRGIKGQDVIIYWDLRPDDYYESNYHYSDVTLKSAFVKRGKQILPLPTGAMDRVLYQKIDLLHKMHYGKRYRRMCLHGQFGKNVIIARSYSSVCNIQTKNGLVHSYNDLPIVVFEWDEARKKTGIALYWFYKGLPGRLNGPSIVQIQAFEGRSTEYRFSVVYCWNGAVHRKYGPAISFFGTDSDICWDKVLDPVGVMYARKWCINTEI